MPEPVPIADVGLIYTDRGRDGHDVTKVFTKDEVAASPYLTALASVTRLDCLMGFGTLREDVKRDA